MARKRYLTHSATVTPDRTITLSRTQRRTYAHVSAASYARFIRAIAKPGMRADYTVTPAGIQVTYIWEAA